jgi:hypothetical protein
MYYIVFYYVFRVTDNEQHLLILNYINLFIYTMKSVFTVQ